MSYGANWRPNWYHGGAASRAKFNARHTRSINSRQWYEKPGQSRAFYTLDYSHQFSNVEVSTVFNHYSPRIFPLDVAKTELVTHI